MDPNKFNAVQTLLDQIAELAEKHLDSEEVRRLLAELGEVVGKGRLVRVR